jgi:hypothetical protein
LDLFEDGFEVETAAVESEVDKVDVDIHSLQWGPLEQRLSDRIGVSAFSLFAPDERGWHSCVMLKVTKIPFPLIHT